MNFRNYVPVVIVLLSLTIIHQSSQDSIDCKEFTTIEEYVKCFETIFFRNSQIVDISKSNGTTRTKRDPQQNPQTSNITSIGTDSASNVAVVDRGGPQQRLSFANATNISNISSIETKNVSNETLVGSDRFQHSFISSNVTNAMVQNLAVMDQVNLTECMARVNCEEQCKHFANNGRANINGSVEVNDPSLPSYVNYFLNSGKKGIEFGEKNACDQCVATYPKCKDLAYDYTRKTNDLYREMARENLTLNHHHESHANEVPEDLRYLHHSMEFIDLANLTQCYARVSCESTCAELKQAPKTPRPPLVSPFLVDDPHKPASVDIIHGGHLLGYALGRMSKCDLCTVHFPECKGDRYTIARASSVIFG